MGDINIPSMIDSASKAIQDNVPETVKETDGVLSSVVGFFNNVVLYPVKKANLTFRYKLECFEEDLKKKTDKIPAEKLQMPPLMIAGPTLEALKYTYDEEELREMYENLLASSMDASKVSQAHPAFVDTIKQMSPLDAKVLQMVVSFIQLRCAKIIFNVRNTNQVYLKGMPNYFVVELSQLGDPFDVSTALNNLSRLGLINIHDQEIVGVDYEEMKNHWYVLSRIELFKKFDREFDVNLIKQTVALNNYGECFAKVCLDKEI